MAPGLQAPGLPHNSEAGGYTSFFFSPLPEPRSRVLPETRRPSKAQENELSVYPPPKLWERGSSFERLLAS